MTTRYDQLVELIRRCRPQTVVEVGVHRGLRAALMITEALRHRLHVRYIGFDVFETMDAAFHEAALNGKGIALEAEARRRVRDALKSANGSSANFVVGDTRETLHYNPIRADFAFIDGDHRVEVIRGDAAAIDAPVLVFDDYYREPSGCEGLPVPQVDLKRFGANVVVHEMRSAGADVEILPVGDMCKHGARAYLAVVRRLTTTEGE